MGTRGPQVFHFSIYCKRLVSRVAVGVYAGRRISLDAQICWIRGLGGDMIAIPGVTIQVGVFAARNHDHAAVSAKKVALVLAAVVMWLVVLAIITVV